MSGSHGKNLSNRYPAGPQRCPMNEHGEDWRSKLEEEAGPGVPPDDLAHAREPGRGREANTPKEIPTRGWKDASGRGLSGTSSRIELRFGHANDQPSSLLVDADIETNSYTFDMPRDPDQAKMFWTAFTFGTHLTVLNGYGVEIGRFSLMGSRRAFEDFFAIADH